MSDQKATNNLEKRKYQRAFFSNENEVTGKVVVAPLDIDQHIPVRILDLSLGGIFFTLRRTSRSKRITEDTQVRLCGLTAASFIKIDTEVDMLVRRVQDHSIVEHVGFGCEFVDLSSEVRSQLDQLIFWGSSDKNVL